MTRPIRRGDVLIRYLTPFGVWHYGMVTEVKAQTLDDIFVIELADSSGIAKSTLREFMYGRYYFWIDNFDEERARNSTYDVDETISRAYKLFQQQKLIYTMNKYNCEYFVRRCIFTNPALWISKQTRDISRDKVTMLGKLLGTIVQGIASKYIDLSRLEFDLNKDKQGYEVCLECGNFWDIRKKSSCLTV